MIRGIVASLIAAAIAAICAWVWFAVFADAFLMYPLAFVLCGVIALAAGLAVGTIVSWMVWKRRDETAHEESIDDIEREFRNMSFGAKGLCLTPAEEGVRDISGEEDLAIEYGDKDWQEAVEAGFILVEECGTHQHRIHATEKLLMLSKAKPAVFEEVHQDLARDLTENFVIQQTMGEDGRMSPPKLVDRLTGEETDRWVLGGNDREHR